MNKIAKLFKAIKLIIQRPVLLNLILNDQSVLQKKFEKRYGSISIKEIDIFDWPQAQQLNVSPMSFLSGSSLVTDFALLQILSIHYKVNTYFEIGTWRGESVANVSPFVTGAYTLNLPDETMRKLGHTEAYIDSHRYFSKKLSNVTHLFGDSATFDFSEFYGRMDLIFIDGDHSLKAVQRDTQTALKLQKSLDSIIVWHDAKSDTEYPRYEVLMGILNGLPKEMHPHVFLVRNSLCAVYLPNHHQYHQLQINALPTRFFELSLSQQNLQIPNSSSHIK